MARIAKKITKRTAVQAMKGYLRERFAPLISLENDAFTQRFRVQRVAARHRERLAEKAFQAAGVDTAHIEKLHRREQATQKRLARAQMNKVRAFARQRAKANRKQIALTIPRLSDFPDPLLEPSVVVLETAASIDNFAFKAVPGGSPMMGWYDMKYATGKGRNTTQGYGLINTGRYDAGTLTLLLNYHFVWPSSRSGLLRATSITYSDLWYFLTTDSTCAGQTAEASIHMDVMLTVGQHSPTGDFNAMTLAPAAVIDDRIQTSGLLDPTAGWTVRSPLVCEVLSGGPLPFPIVPDLPVVCTVSVYLYIGADTTGAVGVYFDRTLSINVPLVLLNID
jgi:hypothetical protein